MGSQSSCPTAEVEAQLLGNVDAACVEAARRIAQADVLVLCTGAGFSADSGLAIYADVAKVEAYAARGLEYHDICQPQWLRSEPELFWGFWGQCYNDYRETAPHEGYEIINGWVEQHFRHSATAEAIRQRLMGAKAPTAQAVAAGGEGAEGEGAGGAGPPPPPYAVAGHAGGFFVFTSNVDAHHFDWFHASEIRECHGNTELYQCTGECELIWRAPLDFRFRVDTKTMLAPAGPPLRGSLCRACEGSGLVLGEACSLCDGRCVFFAEGGAEDAVGDGASPEGPDMGTPAAVGRVRGGGRPGVLKHMAPRVLAEGTEAGFATNHPTCPRCGAPARPAILMFGDYDWRDLGSQGKLWMDWLAAARSVASERRDAAEPMRVVVLELGAGCNVPTVRCTSERELQLFARAGADVRLVRINPDLPLGDTRSLRPGGENEQLVVSIMSRGLEALRKIDVAVRATVGDEVRGAGA